MKKRLFSFLRVHLQRFSSMFYAKTVRLCRSNDIVITKSGSEIRKKKPANGLSILFFYLQDQPSLWQIE
jgi:hypothetical protein